MLALVTLAQARMRLRYLHADSDPEIQDMIYAASGAVVDYLGAQADSLLDLGSDGELTSGSVVPSQIERAVLEVVAVLDKGEWEPSRSGGLPHIAEMMLYRLTDPPCA